jgi:hypothetical protein
MEVDGLEEIETAAVVNYFHDESNTGANDAFPELTAQLGEENLRGGLPDKQSSIEFLHIMSCLSLPTLSHPNIRQSLLGEKRTISNQ